MGEIGKYDEYDAEGIIQDVTDEEIFGSQRMEMNRNFTGILSIQYSQKPRKNYH